MHLVVLGVGEIVCLIGIVLYEFFKLRFFVLKEIRFLALKPLSFKFPKMIKILFFYN